MSKKIKMTKEQEKLFFEMKKLVKRANQRILRLERLTGLDHPFAVKQLYDYIDEFAISEKGRVRTSKAWDLKQMKIVKKAVEDFVNSDFSSIKKLKKYKQSLEEEVRDDLSWKQVNVMYEAKKHWDWILDYIPRSEFFKYFVEPAKEQKLGVDIWIERLGQAVQESSESQYGERIPDIELRKDLEDLYNYFVRE